MGYIWWTYSSKKQLFIEAKLIWAAVVVGIAMLLSCRFHYSIDILIAFYLTSGVWMMWSYLSHVDCGVFTSTVRWFQVEETKQNLYFA